MPKIIRTREQMLLLQEAFLKELGDPNIRYGKEETRQWLNELNTALSTQIVTDEWSELGYWLVNEKSTLGSDYGIVSNKSL